MNRAPARGKPTRSPHPARSSAPLAIACVVAAAVVLAVAIVAWPRGHGQNTPPSGLELAANRSNDGKTNAPTATTTATPVPSRTARQINLDLGPLITSTATEDPPTPIPSVTPTPTPRRPVRGKDELVPDGAFETDRGAWYLEPGAAIVTGDAHGGSGLLALAASGGYADCRVTVTAGTTYRLTMWVAIAVGGDAGQVGIRFEDAAHNRLPADTELARNVTDPGWTEVTITFTVPDGAVQAIVSIWYPGGSGAIAVDDVSLRTFA
jgi:hypothetical protein